MPKSSCPCGSSLAYAHCCGRHHAGITAPTAEALMRSRYCAYVLQLEDYLLATWHSRTRPEALHLGDPSQRARWLGLQVRAMQSLDETHAMVEFVARFRHGGGAAQRLHECSRFVREDGCWFYVDGDML